jgi:hypothetical protein
MNRHVVFLMAMAVTTSGCFATGPIVVEPGKNVFAAECPVPVRATITKVEDRRGSTDANNIGSVRETMLTRPIIVSRSPADALKQVLDATLQRCAPPPGQHAVPLMLQVDLGTLQVNQNQVDRYLIETKAEIAFSVRVFDAAGDRFLESFDVHEDYELTSQLGAIPEPQFVLDQILNEGSHGFAWQFVPAIRKHGS